MHQPIKSYELNLFTVLLGCKPQGRNVEQHDVLFGVANKLDDLSDTIKDFWYKPFIAEVYAAMKKMLPGLDAAVLKENLMKTLSRRDKVHIDAWMQVEYVDGYKVSISRKADNNGESKMKLYFINLGGYKENEFEEYHKKLFVVASTVSEALEKVMSLDFMKDYSPASLGIAGSAHLDDQYKIDFEADDIVCVSEAIDRDYAILLEKTDVVAGNKMTVGYTQINYPE